MEPTKKAEQIKRHFKEQLNTEVIDIRRVARAYIGQLMNDVDLKSGNYKWNYQDEWRQYTSYWWEVLKSI